MTNLAKLLSVKESREYSDLRGVEYLFHDAIDNDALHCVLRKFPRYQIVDEVLRNQVLKYEPLHTGWVTDVVNEVNTLIKLTSDGKSALEEVTKAEQTSVDCESDEVLQLNGELNKVFRRVADVSLDAHERAFLREFFYGVDFTHWSKWAILFHYTDIETRLPALLRARRNGVDFSIKNNTLIYYTGSAKST